MRFFNTSIKQDHEMSTSPSVQDRWRVELQSKQDFDRAMQRIDA